MQLKSSLILAFIVTGCADSGKRTDPPELNTGFAYFEGGTFVMGLEIHATVRSSLYPFSERKVTIPPFEMSQAKVTVLEFSECVSDGACDMPLSEWPDSCNFTYLDERLTHPVNCVSWNNAQKYLAWLGNGFRLPTEAEWEFAATTGDDQRVYPWGYAAPTCDHVAVSEMCGMATGTVPNGSRTAGNTPAPHALQDMMGNLVEHVQDSYHATFNCAEVDAAHKPFMDCFSNNALPLDGSAWIDSATEFTTVRGAAYNYLLKDTKIHRRGPMAPPDHVSPHVGFRVARSR